MISEGPLQLNYSTGSLSATGWFQALHAKATWNTHTRTHTISTYEFSIQRQHSLRIRCEFLTIFNYKCLFCILVKTIESLLLRKIQRDLLFILTPGWRQIFNYQINSSWHFFHLAPRISWEQCAALRQMLDFFSLHPHRTVQEQRAEIFLWLLDQNLFIPGLGLSACQLCIGDCWQRFLLHYPV